MKTLNCSLPATAGSARRLSVRGRQACLYYLELPRVDISGLNQRPRAETGPTFQLALPEGGSYISPSVSRDGKWMAYDTYSPGKPNAILLRDLSTGADHFLDEKGRRARIEAFSSSTLRPSTEKLQFLLTGHA